MEWGVKAIIWEEKKNDLSSGCQQRKRLCIRKKGARQRQVLVSLEFREVRVELFTATITQFIWNPPSSGHGHYYMDSLYSCTKE